MTVFGLGALCALPVVGVTTDLADATASATGLVVYLGIAATGLAYWLWTRGLQRLSLSTIVTITLLEPATAAILATSLLAEPLTATRAVGIATVVAGVLLASLAPDSAGRTDTTNHGPAVAGGRARTPPSRPARPSPR